MVDRIRYPTVSYLPFYYVFFQFLLLTIFNLQANILTTKDILSNLVHSRAAWQWPGSVTQHICLSKAQLVAEMNTATEWGALSATVPHGVFALEVRVPEYKGVY